MRRLPAIVTLASLGLILIAPQLRADEATKVIKLHQEPPVLANVDLGKAGGSHGDMLAFEAALTGEGGAKATLHGLLITVDIPDGADTLEDRSGQLYIDFGGGNSVVIAGRSVYEGGQAEMTKGTPQLRAIIGGTGEYMGARGQVSSVRNADNSYDHTLELVH